jgi:DNA helicase II / ATP-dependent DNA helicase PcrA
VSSSDFIFNGLSEAQKEAVSAIEGPVLILAGAGSGKTRALTHRIAHLIDQGVPAWQILAVTFTNKAANEMKERVTNLLHLTESAHTSPFDSSAKGGLAQGNRQHSLPVMGTFHSVCVRILRRDIEHIGRNRNFAIYDADDQEKLMKEVLKEMNIDVKELKPKTALGHIGKFKCEAYSPKEVAEQASSEWMARMVKIYSLYQAKLRTNGALDFDDLILETVRLFREVPAILERYQETWRYLNVDEYQDTNHAQYLLISLLAEKYRNLCVIGDPDQSIYAFRGADIRNILEFQREYEDATSIKLERNYRSTQQILDCADRVIEANQGRPQKKMWTERVDGDLIIQQEVADEKEEAREAVKRAMELMAHGIPLNEQVILYRTNAQSRLFEEACMKAGMPYRIVGGVKFYARREVKDVLAYLYAIHNPSDALSLLRIINVPSRKIGKTTMERIQALCTDRQIDLWTALKLIARHAEEKPATPFETHDAAHRFPQGDVARASSKHVSELLNGPIQQRIAHFVTIIEHYREKRLRMRISELTKDLLQKIKMEEWVKDGASTKLSTGTSEGEERWQNIGELLSVMHKYDALEPEQSLTSFLEEAALVSEVDKLNEVRNDALTLMTLHLCKGLEFRHVMIAGCEEGIFPHSNALFDKEQLEEERRLMYVGMTRAKDHLRLLHARSRLLWGQTQANPPSRFLDDLPPEHIERKSDDSMSAALWKFGASRASHERSRGTSRETSLDLDFNQDSLAEDFNQDRGIEYRSGVRIRHPVFGEGTVKGKRGDIVDIEFDSGARKSFALSIAPLQAL